MESSVDRITSNAGALLLREVDRRLGLTSSLGATLDDGRDSDRVRYTLTELIRERIYARALGYETMDDCDILAHDPAVRAATWDRRGDRVVEERLASQPTQSRLVRRLAHETNRAGLRTAPGDWSKRHQKARYGEEKLDHATVDVDGFPLKVHGKQEGGAFNGYYRETI